MKYGICRVSVSPIRAEATDRSEMVSQLLFGEKVWIEEMQKSWWKIKTFYDDYEGWVDPKQLLEITQKEFDEMNSDIFTSELFNLAIENEQPYTLTIGAVLSNYQNGIIRLGNKSFDYLGEFTTGKKSKSKAVEVANLYLNTPYLWGGKSSFGIDCSGLVQQVYKLCGYRLPRDAYQQAKCGEMLNFLEEAEPGDLAFFDNEDGRIIHVGIIMEGNKIIHSHGKVRIDPIDVNGIFNTDSQAYSHSLRFVKSFDFGIVKS